MLPWARYGHTWGKSTQALRFQEVVVPRRGLEPPRGCPHMDLNHARLPIPPPRQGGTEAGIPPALVGGELYHRSTPCQRAPLSVEP